MSAARSQSRESLDRSPVREFLSLSGTLKTVLEQLSPEEKKQWWTYAGQSLSKSGLREHDAGMDAERQSLVRLKALKNRDG